AGARGSVASNGIEAVAALENSPENIPFDLVLMDLQMPEMDGYEATRRIRQNPRFAGIPIVAMTAHAMIEERLKCLQAGMNDHISKPIEVDKFFNTLRAWLHLGGESPEDGIASGETGKTDTIVFGSPVPSLLHMSRDALTPETERDSPALPDLPGLNVDAAVSRLNDNREMYVKILRQFLRTQRGSGELYEAAAAAGDAATQTRIAKTLRGLGGSIGATILATAAAELESALASGNAADAAEAAKDTFDALGSLITMLQTAFPDEPLLRDAPPDAAPSPSGEVDGTLAALVSLLSDDDAASLKYLEQHSATLEKTLGANIFTRVEQAVSRFELDEALALLRESGKIPR
ncbi:MAG: response regulator, partial [Deltaproteobacteria bacterium]|nr:response regulator [Deltaproteobacteria bacterium]